MSAVLTINDAGDGTGGSAVISGSLGATNHVYYTPWTGSMIDGGGNSVQMAWTLAGTQVGDGTVALTIGKGYWQFLLISNGALGPAVYQNFTDGSEAFHYQYLVGTRTRMLQLSLAGLTPNQLKIAWLPRATEIDMPSLPLIYISPPGFEQELTDGVMNQDDFLYPTIIAMMVKQKQDSVANLQQVLKWREQILRSIVNQRVQGIQPSMWATPKMMNIIDPNSFVNQGILLSALGFGYRTRMTRGLT
jgi:hypothetical protein